MSEKPQWKPRFGKSSPSDQVAPVEAGVETAQELPGGSDSDPAVGGHSPEKAAKLTPFTLAWSFGYNRAISPLNLTTANKHVLLYASSHAGVLYDYKLNEMHLLLGHQNAVSSIASDDGGKWVATADIGEDNVVIVWDSELYLPMLTLFNPHVGGTRVVGLSPDAKYLVSVNDTSAPKVAFWLWTFGQETPNGTYSLDTSFGKINHIAFNPNISNQFVVTSSNKIAFFTWENNQLSCHVPEYRNYKIGTFSESLYLPITKQTLTSTNKGYVAVWHTLDTVNLDSNTKQMFKEVRLQRDGITSIRAIETTGTNDEDVKTVIVIGNSHGQIRFYDHVLRILYWIQKFDLDSVASLNFPLMCRKYQYKDPFDSESGAASASRGTPEPSQCQQATTEERPDEGDDYLINKHPVPSDASLQRRPFIVHDFVVCTAKGRMGIVNFLESKYNTIFQAAEAPITAINTHPEKPQLAVGNKLGHIAVYDYAKKIFLIDYTLPPSKTGEPVPVRSVKYTPSCLYLICGMEDGMLWILNPCTLEPIRSYHQTEGAITKICITGNSKYIAHMDESMCISLYRCTKPTTLDVPWEYLGKQRSHYKPIRDLTFGPKDSSLEFQSRLFSLGEDRVLVEYDLKNSKLDDLRILSMERIEQSAIPYCMTWHPKIPILKKERCIVTANNEFKYKVVSTKTKMCKKTALSPTYGSPVYHMVMLSSAGKEIQKDYMLFASKKQIGIQMLPVNGNPFQSVGMIGHPIQIMQICTNPGGTCMFTVGQDDACVLKWRINTRSVDVMAAIGGEGIAPYYGLIEGGQTGWLFKEMQDMFYYAQILHQGASLATTRQVSDAIALCELPDCMRAIGYFPSEYEVENMLHEVHFDNYCQGKKQDSGIRFEDFVVLYINQRPAFGICADKIKAAFDTFADIQTTDNMVITRHRFLNVLQDRGECFSREQALKYINVLIPKQDNQVTKKSINLPGKDFEEYFEGYHNIPEEIPFSMLMDDILGIMDQLPDQLCKRESSNESTSSLQ